MSININGRVPSISQLCSKWNLRDSDRGGDEEVAVIEYSRGYRVAMDVFGRLWRKKEYSEESLGVTTLVLWINSSHYQAWIYRRDILNNLEGKYPDIWNMELEWVRGKSLECLKNYQIWHHRQIVVEKTDPDMDEELDCLDGVLSRDFKNHHLWMYRIWLVNRCNGEIVESEMKRSNRWILMDPFNNSFWSYRYFLIEKLGSPRDMIRDEIRRCEDLLGKYPMNQSVVNFMEGMVEKNGD